MLVYEMYISLNTEVPYTFEGLLDEELEVHLEDHHVVHEVGPEVEELAL
jgi:hypothetical protein